MSRQYNIRWKKSDQEDLRRAVKNFNAKIKRLEKRNPEIKNLLPEKISVREMKELIETRQDLKRELNALKRFSKRGAETIVNVPNSDYNLKTTKWQKNEMSRRIGIINKKRKKRLEEISDLPQLSRGEELGYTKKDIGMGKADEVSLKPMKAFTPRMNQRDLKYKFKNIMVESQTGYWNKRDLQLKANYKQSLIENFGSNEIVDIIDAIDDMNVNDFRAKFYSETSPFELSYPGNKAQSQSYISAIRSIWLPNKGR